VWYALPVAFAVLAVVVFVVVLALQGRALEASSGVPSSGSNADGVPVDLVEGYHYHVFGDPGPVGDETSVCTLTSVGGPTTVAVTRSSGDEGVTTTVDGMTLRLLGDLVAPRSGRFELRCAQQQTLLVRPDEGPVLVLALAVMASLGLGAIAVVSLIVIIVRRSRSARMAGPPPYGGW
jgi:hypothetical protein